MFVLNTSRPLFQNNPKLQAGGQLRRRPHGADARARTSREAPPPTSYLSPSQSWLQGRAHLPAQGSRPAARRARLPRATRDPGRPFSTRRPPRVDVAQAQILQQNLKAIGLEVEIMQFPRPLLFEKLATRRRSPSTSAAIAWVHSRRSIRGSPSSSTDGRSDSPATGNWSYFNSPKYNRLLRRGVAAHRERRATAPTASSTCSSRGTPHPRFPFANLNAHRVRLSSRRLRRHEPVPRPDRGLPQVTRVSLPCVIDVDEALPRLRRRACASE